MFQPTFRQFQNAIWSYRKNCSMAIYRILSNEKISPPTKVSYSLFPKQWWHNSKIRAEIKSSCLKQDKVNFMERNVVIFFIFYGLDRQSQDLSTDFTPKVCLFGAVMLTKDADQDKYSYSGYGIRFDFRSTFSF